MAVNGSEAEVAAFVESASAQLRTQRQLLLTRVALQPVLDAVNQLPGPADFGRLTQLLDEVEVDNDNKSGRDASAGCGAASEVCRGSDLLQRTKESLSDLLAKLLTLQALTLVNNETVVAQCQEQAAVPATRTLSIEGSAAQVEWKKRRREVVEACGDECLATSDRAYDALTSLWRKKLRPWCYATSDTWSEMIRPAEQSALKTLGALPSVTVKRAFAAPSDELLRKNICPLIGGPQQVLGRVLRAGRADEVVRDLNRLDDTDLYVHLLQRATASAGHTAADDGDLDFANEIKLLVQRSRASAAASRSVDVRASKGRKLRLSTVHEKLVGYMAPAPVKWAGVDPDNVREDDGNLREDYVSAICSCLFK